MFSKYSHAAALLFPRQVGPCPIVPASSQLASSACKTLRPREKLCRSCNALQEPLPPCALRGWRLWACPTGSSEAWVGVLKLTAKLRCVSETFCCAGGAGGRALLVPAGRGRVYDTCLLRGDVRHQRHLPQGPLPICIPRTVWNDVAAQLRSKLLLRCFSSPFGLVRCSLLGHHARIAQFTFWTPVPGVFVHRCFMLQTRVKANRAAVDELFIRKTIGRAFARKHQTPRIVPSQDAAPWAFPRDFQAPTKTSRSGRLLAFLRGGASGSSPRAAGGSSGGSRQLPKGSGHGGGSGRPGVGSGCPGGSGGFATSSGANGSGGGSAGGGGGGSGVAFSGFSTISGAPQGSPFGSAAQSPAMRADLPPSAAPLGWQSASPRQAEHGHQRSAPVGVAEMGSTAVAGGRFMGPRADGSHLPASSQAATAAAGRSGSFTGGGLRRSSGRVVTPAGDAGFSGAGGGSGGGSGRSLRQLSCRTSADAAPLGGTSHSLLLQGASTGSAATRPAPGGADADGGGGGSSGNGVGGGAWASAALADLPPWPVRCASAGAASPLPSAGPGPNVNGPSAAAPPAGPFAGQRANGGPGCVEAVPPPASSRGALLLSGAPRSEDGSPVSPLGRTSVHESSKSLLVVPYVMLRWSQHEPQEVTPAQPAV